MAMVGRTARDSALHAFDRGVAQPMGLASYAWPLDAACNPYGGGGLGLLSRDFLKFGQLLLDEDVWNGQRILSRDFARRSISPHYRLNASRAVISGWIEELPYKDRTVRAFLALGNGALWRQLRELRHRPDPGDRTALHPPRRPRAWRRQDRSQDGSRVLRTGR